MPNLYDIPPPRLTDPYITPSPQPKERVIGYSEEENAIRTWARTDSEKYLRHLMLPKDTFVGKKLLDVGCGAFPFAAASANCDIFGLEPLLGAFKKLGFPLGDPTYSDNITCMEAPAEKVPVGDNFFDAIVSVNAIDHVDDFPLAAYEICRVIKPDGILVFAVQYHDLPQLNHAN